LLGKYAWADHGSDEEAAGPLLKKGLTLELRVPEYQPTLSNVTGQLDGLENSGDDLTMLKEMKDDGGVVCWSFELRAESVPTSWRLYVSEYKDDNGFPFIEVRNSNSSQYAYGKRQVNFHKPVGFTQAEKERIHFLPVSDASMSERRYQYEKRTATKEEVDRGDLDESEFGAPHYLHEGKWIQGLVSSSIVTLPSYLYHNRILRELFFHWKPYSGRMCGQKRAPTTRKDLY
jgi:hypothetical protein